MNTPHQNTHPAPKGVLFWIAFVMGWSVAAFGFWSLIKNESNAGALYALGLAFGSNIFHDAVVAPVACAVGYLVTRVVPGRLRAQVSWGLFASAIVVAVGYVPLSGFGRRDDNPTVLPLDYPTAVGTVLIVVWIIVALTSVVPALRRKRQT